MACQTSKGNVLERILHDPSAEPTNLPLSLLEDITDDFSEHQEIGKGGFAHVYKGSLQNGTVAVKRLSEKFMVDDKTFYQEVHSLMKVKHQNIVRFLGYCANTEEKFCNYEGKNVMADIRQKMLCFEYLPKGSLNLYITDAYQGLEWKTRYQILKGICEGLHHLHNNRILHLDLKPANVLLNENMEPKISDFGLSRWLDEDQSRVITTNLSGSLGYVAPERYKAEISFKSDIYSLGIIIFEILTGRKGYTAVDKVLESWKARFKTPQGDILLEQVRVCTEIAIQCTDLDSMKRPATQCILDDLYEAEREYGLINTGICTSPATHEKKGSTELPQGIPKVPGETCSAFSTSQHLEKRIDHLPGTALRMEGNATNMESENNVLLHQWFAAIYHEEKSSDPKSSFRLPTPKSENALNGEVKSALASEKKKTTPVSSLATGRQATEAAKTEHAKSAQRNEVLTKKIEGAEKKIEQLQDTVQRHSLNKLTTPKSEKALNGEVKPAPASENNRATFVKSSLATERQATKSVKREHAKSHQRNEELIEKIREAEKRIEQPQDTVQRLEEKETNMESDENKVICQQVVAVSPTTKSLAAYLKSLFQLKTPKNGNALNGEVVKSSPDVAPISLNSKDLKAEEKPPKSHNQKQQENQDMLIKCVSQDLGFSSGRPIAAYLIYRCFLHWRSFEAERTGVFNGIICTMIGSAIEDKNDKLAYWLANSSTLLQLLQRTLKTTGAAALTPHMRRSSAASFGGMQASPQSAGLAVLGNRMIGGLGDLGQVETKHPALLFRQELTAFLETIYGMIRDNLKKVMSPLLGLCIQSPRKFHASRIKGSRSQGNALAQQTQIAYWQSIVKILTDYMNVLKANYVPSFLISKLFTQIFSFINVQLFNSLLLRQECCSFSNGQHVKTGLTELQQWCIYATEEYAGSSWDQLKHIRQAIGFLVIGEKSKKTLKEITWDLCPVLSFQQLYRISIMCRGDKYGTHSVSSDVISCLRVMMTEDSNNYNAASSSFLLDDDSSIPFSVDDIVFKLLKEEIEVSDVDMPPLIRENSGFAFLYQRKD